ncbi:protein TIC 62, chloroplastic isoform X2 [Cryptomeria japonica]|uniref:protein TIC 62, chloroplastic isoform X2 n=1 Tax=Cryptomeria japonica TaxID=3369 RepID=UPI0027DA4F7A|nr:protein TIC 62, chloroplastic isoform X2 [Cryptomeria japonica]
MGAMSMHVSSFILHSPGVTLDHKFVGGPTLKFINKKKQRGLFSRSRLILSSGATGKVGSRTVRELLKLGFRVRAGVRSLQKAEPLLESVAQLKLDSQSVNPSVPLRPTEEKKIEIAVCDLEKPNEIRSAIGNARVVVCCIGASEKEVFDVTGPYRIDYQATKNLIDAATVANIDHFILLTSLGTSKVGFPAALLNLFWGVLIWKRKAEEALISSGLPYSIVRPGGMERPTDTYKETHNLVLASKDTYFGGQVSNLQVAELFACMADNTELSVNKVVEVIAETTAPLLPIKELLAKVSIADGMEQKSTSELVASAPVSQSSVEQDASESAPPVTAEKAEQQPNAMRSLSPYSMYEDLKPPTSPTPKQC